MQLKEYLSKLERGEKSRLAEEMGISLSYLLQLASTAAPISPTRAVEIEKLTNGAVTRKDMFPNDWEKIWPELADAPRTTGADRRTGKERRTDKKIP